MKFKLSLRQIAIVYWNKLKYLFYTANPKNQFRLADRSTRSAGDNTKLEILVGNWVRGGTAATHDVLIKILWIICGNCTFNPAVIFSTLRLFKSWYQTIFRGFIDLILTSVLIGRRCQEPPLKMRPFLQLPVLFAGGPKPKQVPLPLPASPRCVLQTRKIFQRNPGPAGFCRDLKFN